MTETLTRPQVAALAALQGGVCRRSNRTDPDNATVAHATVATLVDAGLAVDVEGRVLLTDTGKDLADDPPPPPPITRDHGTYACYSLDGCRCTRCCWAASEYNRARSRANAVDSRTLTVDADPVRAHVRSLMADPGSTSGVGLKRIAEVSGVSQGALWKLMYGAPDRDGPSRTVLRSTAENLLAVTPADRAPGSTVPAGPTQRRVADLRAAGATWREIGDQIHMNSSNTHSMANNRDQVTVATARAVHDLWNRWRNGDWTPRGKRSRHDDDWTPS